MEAGLNRLAELIRRHGEGVVSVMEQTLGLRPIDEFEPSTLPKMFGEIRRESFFVESGVPAATAYEQPAPELVELAFSSRGKKLMINREINITAKATRGLLFALAKGHLHGAVGGVTWKNTQF